MAFGFLTRSMSVVSAIDFAIFANVLKSLMYRRVHSSALAPSGSPGLERPAITLFGLSDSRWSRLSSHASYCSGSMFAQEDEDVVVHQAACNQGASAGIPESGRVDATALHRSENLELVAFEPDVVGA